MAREKEEGKRGREGKTIPALFSSTSNPESIRERRMRAVIRRKCCFI